MEYKIHYNIIEKLYRNLDSFILNEYEIGKKVVIFGTSKPSQMLLQYLQNREIPVYALVDNNKTKEGNIYSNVKTYIPENILFPYDGSMQILIVSQHQDSMVGQLEKMGYSRNNIHIILDLNYELNNFSISNNCGYKEMTRKEIQLSQIKCLDYLKAVCEKNNIAYYLACGTALGAIRHKGYIPWDDDIDVCMNIRDLKRFINIVKKENKFGIISTYSEGEYLGGDMAKLIDMDTFVHSNHFPLSFTIGISIDVFPLYGLPENEEERKKFITDLKRLEINYFENVFDEKKAKSCLKEMLENVEAYPFSTSTYVGHILTLGYKKEAMVFKREYFDDYENAEFEGNYYRVPKMWHEYLVDLYDDYMVLPEMSKRVAHHHYKAFRVD